MALDDQNQASLTTLQRSAGECVVTTKALNGRTQIDRLRQQGAFKVRFPKFGQDGVLESILINTSGGLTGGDRMRFAFEAGARTTNVISTQACEKFYRSAGGVATVANDITLNEHADVFWCPQESILFRDSRVVRSIDVQMHPSASLCLLEPVVFGREAHREQYDLGTFSDTWRVAMNDKIIHAEHVKLECNATRPLTSGALLSEHTTIATMLLINCKIAMSDDAMKGFVSQLSDVSAAASTWTVAGASKTVLRILAPTSYHLRAALSQIFIRLLPAQSLPKVWAI